MPPPYKRVGYCIYCDSRVFDSQAPRDRLTDEHIIQAAIGGEDKLPNACCRKCKDAIDPFETYMIEAHLDPLRSTLGLRGHRKRTRKSHYKFAREVHNVPQDTFVRMSELPVNFSFVEFHGRPGAFVGQDLSEAPLGSYKLQTNFVHSDWQARARATAHVPMAHVIPPALMARYVAKIAHVYASAEIGANKFESTILNIILLGDMNEAADFIGGEETDRKPGVLHHIAYKIVNGCVLVSVQLFAHFVPYHFEVAVGVLRSALPADIWPRPE